MRKTALAVGILTVTMAMAGRPAAQQGPPEPRWFKGNTHTHTLNSDGDSAPDEVARWYREQHYHFVVITDHNFVTSVEGLNALLAAADRFVVIPGEEITDRAGDKPVHVNALGATRGIKPQGGATPATALCADVEAARAAGALPQVNHPNFGWTLTGADLVQLQGTHLLEIFNGHPQVNNLGGGGSPAAEALWDAALSAGHSVYGVASDDLHDLKRPGIRQAAGPGRGWVMVRAARLAADDIVSALARGDFYASTGVELRDVSVTATSLSVSIREQGTARYRVAFIGKGGKLLKEVEANPAVYDFTGDEDYVRARVTDSNGLLAWTQAARVSSR